MPADTTYATRNELKARVNVTTANNDDLLDQMLDASAELVDAETRGHKLGYEAFSASASEVRYFDDDMSGVIDIDDAVTVTAITRGGVVITLDYYKLYPYNRGNGPATRIYLRSDSQFSDSLLVGGSWYGYPNDGWGMAQIAVTGTWGYCTQANRPKVVKEAVLTQAEAMYEFMSLSPTDAGASQINPWKVLIPRVEMLIRRLKREFSVG
jgi:hypothetical protein